MEAATKSGQPYPGMMISGVWIWGCFCLAREIARARALVPESVSTG